MTAMNTILIVDDETAVQHFFERVLQRDGFQVAGASDGETALGLIAAREFDLVLLDLQLKGIGGLDVLAELRRQWHLLYEYQHLARRHGNADRHVQPAGFQSGQSDVERRQRQVRGLEPRGHAAGVGPDLGRRQVRPGGVDRQVGLWKVHLPDGAEGVLQRQPGETQR